jgi:hypothetical protein
MAVYQHMAAPATSEADPALLKQLQHEEMQGKMALEMAHWELKETQEQLEATSQQNQQLQAQLSLLPVPRKGDGVDKVKNNEAPWSYSGGCRQPRSHGGICQCHSHLR